MTDAALVRRLKSNNNDSAHVLDETANASKQFRALRSLARFLQEEDDCFTEDLQTHVDP